MQHRQLSNTPVWPYILVVTCLFVLSVLAPRFWRSPTSGTGGSMRSQVVTSDAVRTSPNGAAESRYARRRAAVKSSLAESSGGDVPELNQFHAPRRLAPVAPAVTGRIDLGQCVPDVPSLPSLEKGATLDGVAIRMGEVRRMGPPLLAPDAPAGESLGAVSRRTVARLPALAVRRWPLPSALLEQLEALRRDGASRPWAESVIACLQQIHGAEELSSAAVRGQLAALEELIQAAEPLAQRVSSPEQRARIQRARYAVQRRAALWSDIHRVASQSSPFVAVSVSDTSGIAVQVDRVQSRLEGSAHAASWRRYLMLEELLQAARSGSIPQQRDLARRVLLRMESPSLDENQREVLSEPPFVEFSDELRQWAIEPVDYQRLLEELELYEQTRSTESARRLAGYYQVIRWSREGDVQALAEKLNVHYRNANVRVAISAGLMNTLLAQPQCFEEDVRDRILGAHVCGIGRGFCRLRVVLEPDARRWRLGLEAEGTIESQTVAEKGPARFYSDGVSRYLARKRLLVDRKELRAEEAEAEADCDLALRSFETDFDAIPLVGWIARSIARQQHDRQYAEARRESIARLRYRASRRMDSAVSTRIEQAQRELRQKWLGPLEELQLNPVALDMQTTSDELLVRYRLAGDVQLGAHTPRPQAPAGSALSLQIHESAINNTLEQLKLEGKRAELRDLFRQLADTFDRPEIQVPEDIPDDVSVQFADRNAVRVRCDDGRVTLTVSIAELKNGRRNCWRQFAVRAHYAPHPDRLEARLVRDGVIELAGRRLNTMDQVELRTVFSTVFSKNRPIQLVSKRLAENPQLHGLRISQFVVNDGWIGVAVDPRPDGVVAHVDGEDCVQKR